MRRWMAAAVCALLLTGTAAAALPDGLADAAPDAAWDYLDPAEDFGPSGFAVGIRRILGEARTAAGGILRRRVRGAASVLLAVTLCGAVRSAGGEGTGPAVSLAGALAVTALSAGSLEELIGLGWKSIREIDTFSRALLPTLAAATAASGAVASSALEQTAAVFLSETLVHLIDAVLMPLTYLYIGLLTAACALPESRLEPLAAGLKTLISGVLTWALLAFTVYLSVTRVLSGPVDAAAARVARNTVSNVVPVVGGIIAEATEAVLAGAGMLRGSIGVFGMLAVLAACVHPFLQLGAQYLLYRGAAFLASAVGMPELCRLLDGLGGAFGLVLGMTGSCALLLLVAILSFAAAVVP